MKHSFWMTAIFALLTAACQFSAPFEALPISTPTSSTTLKTPVLSTPPAAAKPLLPTSASTGLAVTKTPTPSPQASSSFDPTRLGRTEKDVTYCNAGGAALKMDVYYPSRASATPWPAVIYIHGGAWQKGDKSEGAGFRAVSGLQAAGFLVAAINYRLAPQHPFPAQIQDVKCAVRYLRAHAGQYNLDVSRIGAWGGSAGGHLSALLGTSGGAPGWDVGEYLDQSSRVQAVVDMFGPADLTTGFDSSNNETARLVFGASSPGDPKLAAASPVTYIDAKDPPFLILHGDQDRTVPLEQSQILFQKLQAAGVSARLVVVRGAGHSFAKAGAQPINPTLDEINQQIVDFFTQELRK